jgi:hypothetical protein
MHVICYIALSAIHLAASGCAVHAGAMPDAVCAGAAALVYAALAVLKPREPRESPGVEGK